MSTGQNIVDRARSSLLDPNAVTWTNAELLTYLNAAISQACGTLLDLYIVVTAAFALTAGARQTLPAGGLVFIDAPRNGVGGAVTRELLTELARTRPAWAADAASTNTRYVMFDKRAPTSFLVYPPAAGGTTLELVYGAVPAAIALGDTIPISPAFDTALWAYVLALAYAKNTKRQDMTKYQAFMGVFDKVMDTWKKGKDFAVMAPDPREMT